jgi:hypothetical protein
MKAAWTGFRSPLASHTIHFLATKRALGCRFVAEDRNLRLFDRFLVDQGVATVDAITAIRSSGFSRHDRGPLPRAITTCWGSCVACLTGSPLSK